MPNSLKFVFFGTPEVASETLEILKQNGYLPSLIVTAPDRPKGRKMILTPPPVKIWAIENNIPYLQPEKLSEDLFKFFVAEGPASVKAKLAEEGRRREKFKEVEAFELFIVVAYGKILPEEIINMPKLGSINIHYSLLPKYRGASPVESAILKGETETGVSIQKMEYKMDSGPVLASEKTLIGPDEKTPELRNRLIKIGGELLVKILPDFIENKIKPIPQDEKEATFCKKIKKEDGLVDPEKDDPKTLYNKFRAYATWPRTYFLARQNLGDGGLRNGKRIIITDAKLENDVFKILKIIPEGGKETKYKN